MTPDSATLDPLDSAIVRSLQVAPRIAFRLLAAVLDTSEQTVARRYRRLRHSGVLRVTAVISPVALGQSNWVVRVRCKPSGAPSLAQALARRDDVGWVSIGAGGTEVLCVVRSRTAQAREDLLLQRLPRTEQVLGMTASLSLQPFVAGGSDDWAGLADSLTAEQERRIRASSDTTSDDTTPDDTTPDDTTPDDTTPDDTTPDDTTPAPRPSGITELDAVDIAMLDALVADGRATYAALAEAAGISEGRAARRLRELGDRGVFHLDIDLSAAALGFDVQANIWLTVVPAELDRAGRALSELNEVSFASAISGTHNLLVVVMCRDVAALYRFVTEQVGAIHGITSMEVAPLMRVVKQAGTLMADGRLS